MKTVLLAFLCGALLTITIAAYRTEATTVQPWTPQQVQMRIASEQASHYRWQIFWWSLTISVSGALAGGAYFVVVLAKNRRERVYVDPVTGMFPVVRENRAPFWKRLHGVHDWVIEDANLAVAPTRRIYANGTLQVQADLHGVPLDQQLQYATNSWSVQRAIATSAGGSLRPNAAMLRAASGEFEQRARLQGAKAQIAENRLLATSTQAPVVARDPVQIIAVHDGFARCTATQFPLGYGAHGVALWDCEQSPHVRVHGKTQGSGKTNLIKTIAAGALRAGHHVIVLDRRGFKDWRDYEAHCELIDNRKPGAFVGTMQQLKAIYQQRDSALGAAGVGSIARLAQPTQRIFCVIAEFGTACREMDADELQVTVKSLKSIMSEAGATGVHLVFEDQVVNRNWPRELRGNGDPITGYLPEDTAIAGGYRFAHELKPYEFHMDGQRFHTWSMEQHARDLLSQAAPSTERMIDVRSFVRSVENNNFPNKTPENIFLTNERTNERTNAITDLQRLVWQWRAAHPESASQAAMRRDLEIAGYTISKGYANECWHSWPGTVTPLAQLLASGVALDDIRLPGGERLGNDITHTAEEKYD